MTLVTTRTSRSSPCYRTAATSCQQFGNPSYLYIHLRKEVIMARQQTYLGIIYRASQRDTKPSLKQLELIVFQYGKVREAERKLSLCPVR